MHLSINLIMKVSENLNLKEVVIHASLMGFGFDLVSFQFLNNLVFQVGLFLHEFFLFHFLSQASAFSFLSSLLLEEFHKPLVQMIQKE